MRGILEALQRASDYSAQYCLDNPPWALRWRSKRTFIIATVAISLVTDLFLYGLVVPVLPFMLKERLNIPDGDVQTYISRLLAAYAGASVLFSIPAGWIADRTNSRQAPFLYRLTALLLTTIMLTVRQSISVLVVARILQGISATTIGLAIVLDTVRAENLGKVIGSIFSFISVRELLAPILSSILYDKTSYRGVFGIASAVLTLDFVIRLLIIERKTAIKYDPSLDDSYSNPRNFNTRGQSVKDNSTSNGDPSQPDEESTLLPKSNNDNDEKYKIHDEPSRIVHALPLLYYFRNPRLPIALSLTFVQASLLSVFNATIPIEAKDLLSFSSLEASLLFIALDIPYLILGPAVDKYGTKPAAVISFGYLVPTLALLRIPSKAAKASSEQHTTQQFCAMLALNGIGLAIIGSPNIVEASDIVQRYNKANPGFFSANGPYAQLYSFNSVFFYSGLALRPLVASILRDNIRYGNINAVFATLASVTAVLSF
ncbi:LOW QUALITY PROTEIN: major facilitator superfamily domain-containing protein [Microdochium trichocladiopsis]|uniref:Major facilitator superfamily domain-containing protein n=1 Tax=Microdochium trichocladiopsis TaxID=1682393 RepID=A0A9P8YA54_9PEZI|nr:LOW QUALITY PROTEIN: major facilitator superfamily domain-containing protein [Microdochium trichocladiopsis]KAH7034507.1 LOW QUALITY PROTEIN: major facilitator superfamily domain-containing protein [Microdochium trichocladiopsis]